MTLYGTIIPAKRKKEEEYVEKVVKKVQKVQEKQKVKCGRIYLPKEWIGCNVEVGLI